MFSVVKIFSLFCAFVCGIKCLTGVNLEEFIGIRGLLVVEF